MKCCFGPIAPVAALPCSNEERGSEAYKRKTGRNLLFCTGLALQKEIGVLKLENEWLVFLGGL